MQIFLMNGELPSLSELFSATIDTTDEGLGPRVRVLVLLQVLRESKGLLTVRAHVLLLIQMLQVVTLKRKLARAELLAISNVALVNFLSHNINLFN